MEDLQNILLTAKDLDMPEYMMREANNMLVTNNAGKDTSALLLRVSLWLHENGYRPITKKDCVLTSAKDEGDEVHINTKHAKSVYAGFGIVK